MAWFSITSTIRSGNGTNVPFAFYVEEAETLDDFADILVEDGVVVGDRYRVRRGQGDEAPALTERRRILLTRDGIAQVSEFHNAERFDLLE